MKYRAKRNFSGKISMTAGQIRELDARQAEPLLEKGLITPLIGDPKRNPASQKEREEEKNARNRKPARKGQGGN